ncbi:MAG: TPM domain-containing protein [Candidatus Omnitrophica bacterium]|nr:TPM domain-containing protein [Candidatus Omnitrophota bacterium]
MLRRFLVLFSFLFLVGLPSALALPVPEKPEGYVSDYAGMMSPAARASLESQLAQFERETSNQVVVATFPSLDGESLEDFSIRLAEKWKIGQRDKNNGVIFLIFKNDRKMRIEVGYGLEGALPDATASVILNQIVTPLFRLGKFDDGITMGTQAILAATKGEFKATAHKKSDSSGLITLIFLALLFSLVVDIIRYGFYRMRHKKYEHRFSFWEWWFAFSILLFVIQMLLSSGGSSSSSGGSSSGGGGGFSGGGGSFGGGGSSGGW